jgi:hypothetical protein
MGAAISTAWFTMVVARWRLVRGDVQIRVLLVQLEGWCGRWRTAGMLFLLLTATIFALLLRP